MALSQKALQRKREKKKQIRQAKIIKPLVSASKNVACSSWPIYECWIPAGLWDLGIGHVVVSRRNNLGDIAVGMYLVDVFCLGIKDCFVRLIDSIEYKEILKKTAMNCGKLEPIDPSYANTLIHKAVEYANHLGFKPHSDFSKAKLMLKNIPIDETIEFVFGKNNSPFYIQGPHESPADVKRIMRTLATKVGCDNHQFLVEG